MINNIHDLMKLQQKQFTQLGEKDFHKDLLMYVPGCNAEQIAALCEKIINIPVSYLEVLKQFDVNGTIIGMFSISPISGRKRSITEKILEVYEDPFFPKEFMERHRMYQIGSWNTDLLCVTEGTDQFEEGEILYVDEGDDIYNPEDSQIHPIAKNFEQFLIMAGNLEQIHDEMQGDDSLYPQKQQEFLDRLAKLGVAKKYYPAWLNVF